MQYKKTGVNNSIRYILNLIPNGVSQILITKPYKGYNNCGHGARN